MCVCVCARGPFCDRRNHALHSSSYRPSSANPPRIHAHRIHLTLHVRSFSGWLPKSRLVNSSLELSLATPVPEQTAHLIVTLSPLLTINHTLCPKFANRLSTATHSDFSPRYAVRSSSYSSKSFAQHSRRVRSSLETCITTTHTLVTNPRPQHQRQHVLHT